jgi:hypothetical protein
LSLANLSATVGLDAHIGVDGVAGSDFDYIQLTNLTVELSFDTVTDADGVHWTASGVSYGDLTTLYIKFEKMTY